MGASYQDALDGERRIGRTLACEHALEGRDAAAVKRDAGVLVKEGEGRFMAPGASVDPRRDESVVDIADGEDPGLEIELRLPEPARVAGAVQALVMVEDEPANGRGEVAEGALYFSGAESMRRRSRSAPALSSISFRFPHFGDWTHDGQPRSQGQPSSIRAVSSTQPSSSS